MKYTPSVATASASTLADETSIDPTDRAAKVARGDYFEGRIEQQNVRRNDRTSTTPGVLRNR